MIRGHQALNAVGIAAAMSVALVPASASFAQTANDSYAATHLDGQTEVDKAVGKCIATVAAGAALGALLGGHNRGRGAAIGAGLGVGACAIMLAVANNRDKERLRQLQLQAANTGASQSDQWQTADGHSASATVTTTKVVDVTAPKTQQTLKCRRTNVQLSVGGNESSSSDIVCLQGDSWVTLDKLRDQGITPGSVNL